jgi:DNA-binding MarR family transcriptional regulator/GNAT superfamily N-acetyltransferase
MTVADAATATPSVADDQVAAVRAFNRFYTTIIGVLREGLLESPYSLAEARVIFELAQRSEVDLAHLRRLLGLDAGYLTRIADRLEADGIVRRRASPRDRRRQVIGLTRRGRAVFRTLDRRSAKQVAAILEPLDEAERARLVGAMTTIKRLLQAPTSAEAILRDPRPGEFGWVISLHGAVYAQEYGWDESFEALVARVVAEYLEGREAGRERAWVAELEGEPVGCVFCVRGEHPATAKLRLLLVEPWARGRGVGTRLVNACTQFATEAGYERITLWTNDVLDDARRLYQRAGFELVRSHPHHSFGKELVGQDWELALTNSSRSTCPTELAR